MAEQWPSSLQEFLNEESFALKEGDTNIETNMDVGPKKRRARITKGFDELTCSITVNTTEYTTFKNFYRTTLANGINRFEFNHPITGELKEWRLVSPSYRSLGGGHYQINMLWEEM